MIDIMPEDLKERFEKYKNTIAELAELAVIYDLSGVTLEEED
jgi:hypothetical protein